MASAEQLIGGYWEVNPSPIVDQYAAAWTYLSGPLSGSLAGSAPKIWTIKQSDAVFPGLNGQPTVGYPAPVNDALWIASSLFDGPLLAANIDYVIENDYIWFNNDPFFSVHGYPIWDGGRFVRYIDLWYGTAPARPESTPNLEATAYALAQAIASGCDSPATGKSDETVAVIWQAKDGTSWVVTDAASYHLSSADPPSVAVGDVLPPGTPLGSAWTLTKLGSKTNLPYVTTPDYFQQGVTAGAVTWYQATTPLVIDSFSSRTRVRFALGTNSQGDLDNLWTAATTNGIANGRTLAQALDIRSNPVGDPGPESLPTVISPMEFLCRELLAGCAYRLLLFTDKFGSKATSVAEITTAARIAAGSYSTLFVWENSEPELTLRNPS